MSYTNPFPNVPSASKLGRIMECPASHKAEQAAGDVPEDTRDADAGQDVHAVLSDDLSADDVSYSAAQTAEMCEEQVERLLAEWQLDGIDIHGEALPETIALGYKELRYGLTDIGAVIPIHDDTKASVIFTVIFTGQFDRLYIQGERGFLIDFKALHGKHASALENPQLMGLAVLVAKRHKLTSLRVALVQPWKGKPTVADYGGQGLLLAEMTLLDALEIERNAGPEDRKAGEWCKYCRARFSCDTFKSQNIAALDIVKPETLPADPDTRNKAVFARMAELSPQQLIHIQKNVVKLMGVFIASHAAIFKQRVEAGEIPGFTLKERSGRRKITDVATAYERAAAHGVTAESFTAKCSLSMKGLNEALKDATKAKGKALERMAAQVLDGITETGKPVFEVVEVAALE
ncbi:Protein of unknown function DUF2800 [uncultured Caudovirales phage]|uniref:Uncharacterized protein n=1 Tax=uncultured Caudovirales phage TaxID=2100421 RepID=A0A6J5PC15_9CAUD|nr:Protein of unknown function DUF2800 [uncultured Caudovirales phage]